VPLLFLFTNTDKKKNPAPNNDNAIATSCSFNCLIKLTNEESECEYEPSQESLRLVGQEDKQIQPHVEFAKDVVWVLKRTRKIKWG